MNIVLFEDMILHDFGDDSASANRALELASKSPAAAHLTFFVHGDRTGWSLRAQVTSLSKVFIHDPENFLIRLNP